MNNIKLTFKSINLTLSNQLNLFDLEQPTQFIWPWAPNSICLTLSNQLNLFDLEQPTHFFTFSPIRAFFKKTFLFSVESVRDKPVPGRITTNMPGPGANPIDVQHN